MEKIFHFLVGSEHLWNLWRSICILLKHVINYFLTKLLSLLFWLRGFNSDASISLQRVKLAGGRGVLGCPWPPNVSLFFKQTTHNIQVRKLVSALCLTQGCPEGAPLLWKILATSLFARRKARGGLEQLRLAEGLQGVWDSLWVLDPRLHLKSSHRQRNTRPAALITWTCLQG